MSRLIDADKLDEVFFNKLFKGERRYRYVDWDDCRNIIDSQPTISDNLRVELEKNSEENSNSSENLTVWIPCGRELPKRLANKRYQVVLVTLNDGEIGTGVYRDRDDGKWWSRRLEGEMLYTDTHDIIAWQPLPESYREDR